MGLKDKELSALKEEHAKILREQIEQKENEHLDKINELIDTQIKEI